MKKNIKTFIIDLLFYIVGSCIYSAGVLLFTESNELSPGGITGVALLLNHLFDLPVGLMVLAINIPLIIAGFLVFGKKFIFKTAIATLVLSLSLDAMETFIKPFVTDVILAAIFGGIILGAGVSLVLLRGATTGGTDIIAKLINHRFPFVSMGRIVMAVDVIVVITSAVVYKNFESALYSVVLIFVSSKLIDNLLYGADKGKFMHIITNKPDEVSEEIFAKIDRGVTRVEGKGAYTGEQRPILLCAVRPSEVAPVRRAVKAIDPQAFLIISDAGEVLGEGFKKNE